MTNLDPAVLLGWYAVFIFSASLHEAAHAWAALIGGDDTAYAGGQVSLNPIPHIKREPFGMVVFPFISLVLMGWPLGYASAPYNPLWAQRHPKRAAYMALAGPASNLVVALLAVLAMWIGLKSGNLVFANPDNQLISSQIVSGQMGSVVYGLGVLLSMLFVMNFLLFLLNIMPVPPLDGSEVIALFLKPTTMDKYREIAHSPMVMIVGFVLVMKLVGIIFWPAAFLLLRFL